MFNPAPISPASHASIFHPSPHLHRLTNPVREDSSVEPPALPPACWPASPLIQHEPPTPPRRFPRSYTAPPNSFSSLSRHPLSFESDTLPPFHGPTPVQLSPALSPSMRDALPQPKPLRPHPPPFQSELSIASTRAENEPLAVRDLRRVTAPPALLDPWQYDPSNNRQSHHDRDPRRKFMKSMSATSGLTERLHQSHRERSATTDHRPWRLAARIPYPDRIFLRRKWFNRSEIPMSRIPDRFHDDIDDREHRPPPKDDSVTSALTADSDQHEDNIGFRWRAQSDIPARRSSFLLGKEKVVSIWEKLRRRRRPTYTNRHQTSHTQTTLARHEKRLNKDRERRPRFPTFFRPVEVDFGAPNDW